MNKTAVLGWLGRIGPYVGMALFLFLWLDSCSAKREESNRYKDNMEVKEDVIKTITLKNGQQASQISAYQVTEKELKDQVWVKDDSIKDLLEKLKNPKVIIKTVTITKFDTIRMPFSEEVPFEFSRDFKSETQYYSFSGLVTNKGITLDAPEIYNTQRVALDYPRGKPRVTITNSNPYINTTQIDGQIVTPKKKRWVVAVGPGYNVLQPIYFGIFGGYKIFEF